MENVLTFNDIIELPNEIIHNAEKYSDFNDILNKELCSTYDLKEIKDKIEKLFDKFKEIKYLYNYSFEEIKITPSYELKENAFTRNISSPFENAVINDLDKHLWIQKFYNQLVSVSNILTIEEAIYLVNSFFCNKSEDVIAEKLGITTRTLYNIKKSCLIKVWSAFKTFEN